MNDVYERTAKTKTVIIIEIPTHSSYRYYNDVLFDRNFS